MDSELQKQHEHMGAYDMIVHLRQLYQVQARHEQFDVLKALFWAKLIEGSPVGPHVLNMIGCDSGALKPKAKVAKDDCCFHCGNSGHWKRNCKVYLEELKKKKGSETSTSDTSVYNVETKRLKSNDSNPTYLWHCRLGLIGENRISRLHKDGLLDSFDFESIETCEPCLMGKMTTTPFTGKGEQASDLLALIHTDETRGYYFYNPTEGKVFVARTAIFLEKEFLFQGTSGRKLGLGEVLPQNDINQSMGKVAGQPQGVVIQSSTQVTQEPRRFGRIRHEPERYGFLVTQDNDVLLVDNDEPTTYAEAVTSPDSEKWLEAMRSEMEFMYANQVWTLVDPPEGVKPIGSYYDYEIWQMDVKIAFLNGRLLEDVYMTQPEGFVDPQSAGKICKLQRSIYGLKQASRSWNLRFNDVVKEFGFIKNKDEPCVYKKVSGSTVIFLVLYVDDILLIGNDIPSLQFVKTWLGMCFSIKDLGEAIYVLGVVSGKSSKQETVADSTTEAKHIAATNAVKGAVWIKKFVTELAVVPSITDLVELYCDNNRAIAQAKEPRSHQRSKHILRRFHLIREIVDRGDVKICRIPTNKNLADPLTKPLVQSKHKAHTRSLGIRDMPDWL
ncbi:hypothetical protein CRG98_042978 [Punica granatum]|uniref:CCHC-type domain-containing protein n=1 Tax=Punica granatum TaxID=22663 RepID=A0A2I0HY53_PUNGR|nr:hypothetical protein CRG98_042978 [Punica granatum]